MNKKSPTKGAVSFQKLKRIVKKQFLICEATLEKGKVPKQEWEKTGERHLKISILSLNHQ